MRTRVISVEDWVNGGHPLYHVEVESQESVTGWEYACAYADQKQAEEYAKAYADRPSERTLVAEYGKGHSCQHEWLPLLKGGGHKIFLCNKCESYRGVRE